MSTTGEKIRALLATGRVANLPTVWSNVMVAFCLSHAGFFNLRDEPEDFVFWSLTFIFLLAASSVIYVGGCMLGDVRDIAFDSKNRPSRPLPRGVLSPSLVTIAAWCLLFSGLLLTAISPLVSGVIGYDVSWDELVMLVTSKQGLIIVQAHELILVSMLLACVISYALFHKRNKILALTLMSCCRLLLIMLAVAVAHKTFFQYNYSPEPFFIYRHWAESWMPILACTVAVYTLLLSWVASTESKPGAFHFRTILAILLLLLPFVSLLIATLLAQVYAEATVDLYGGRSTVPPSEWQLFPPSTQLLATMICLFIGWMLYALKNLKTSKPTFVSNALAGFCLLDACIAATYSTTLPFICFGLFVLALLLQKVTPAT